MSRQEASTARRRQLAEQRVEPSEAEAAEEEARAAAEGRRPWQPRICSTSRQLVRRQEDFEKWLARREWRLLQAREERKVGEAAGVGLCWAVMCCNEYVLVWALVRVLCCQSGVVLLAGAQV
jgi:hypothetical protein